jgi:hypothetical protein
MGTVCARFCLTWAFSNRIRHLGQSGPIRTGGACPAAHRCDTRPRIWPVAVVEAPLATPGTVRPPEALTRVVLVETAYTSGIVSGGVWVTGNGQSSAIPCRSRTARYLRRSILPRDYAWRATPPFSRFPPDRALARCDHQFLPHFHELFRSALTPPVLRAAIAAGATRDS